MCRSIKRLFNFDPPANNQEIQEAALQFVRKISGFQTPSQANEQAFNRATKDVAKVTSDLLNSLVTNAPARNREKEAQLAKARAQVRYSRMEK